MIHAYIWWISRFPILSIYICYPYLSKIFVFWERENGCFFFTCVVWTTIHHATLNNRRYILLQQSLNLIFNITTLLSWYISCLHPTCLISTATLRWKHINNIMSFHWQHNVTSQKQHNKKRKNTTRRKVWRAKAFFNTKLKNNTKLLKSNTRNNTRR